MCASPYVFDGVLLPCGKCRQCRKARTREWSARLLHELNYHNTAVFVTLTYAPQYLPDGLNKHHLQLFFKRLRKALNDRPIKYYAVGEYGAIRDRPHYHIILYGMSRCGDCVCCNPKQSIAAPAADCKLLFDAWGQGVVDVGTVTSRSCYYVTSYVQSKLIGKLSVVYGNRVPPFALQSQGLGKQWALDHAQHIKDTLKVDLNGHPIAIPRYYRDKIKMNRDLRNQLILRGYDKMIDYCRKIAIDLPDDYDDACARIKEMLRYGRQREYNLKALADIAKARNQKGGQTI